MSSNGSQIHSAIKTNWRGNLLMGNRNISIRYNSFFSFFWPKLNIEYDRQWSRSMLRIVTSPQSNHIYLSYPSINCNFNYCIGLSCIISWCGGCYLPSSLWGNVFIFPRLRFQADGVSFRFSLVILLSPMQKQKSSFPKGKSNELEWKFVRPQSFNTTREHLCLEDYLRLLLLRHTRWFPKLITVVTQQKYMTILFLLRQLFT